MKQKTKQEIKRYKDRPSRFFALPRCAAVDYSSFSAEQLKYLKIIINAVVTRTSQYNAVKTSMLTEYQAVPFIFDEEFKNFREQYNLSRKDLRVFLFLYIFNTVKKYRGIFISTKFIDNYLAGIGLSYNSRYHLLKLRKAGLVDRQKRRIVYTYYVTEQGRNFFAAMRTRLADLQHSIFFSDIEE